VTVYSALSKEMNGAIQTAFEKAQPVIGLEILTLAAAGDLEAHVRAEKNAPRADILLGGSSEYHDSLGKDGLLDAYRPAGSAGVDAPLKDPDGFWTGWYMGILGIAVNADRWGREHPDKAMPASWDDLLDPGIKATMAMPDPLTTGAGYIFLANQYFRFGRDESRAMDFMKKLHTNVGTYTGTAPLAIEEVGKGADVLAVNWGHDVLTAAGKGQPIRFVAPENTAYEVGGVSIVKGGPNLAGARALVDWILSRDAADVIVRLSNRISVLKRVETTPGAPTLDSVKLVDYDRAWATSNKERLLADWRAAVGR
jgi:iron(III) transport system substrate-binding protein